MCWRTRTPLVSTEASASVPSSFHRGLLSAKPLDRRIQALAQFWETLDPFQFAVAETKSAEDFVEQFLAFASGGRIGRSLASRASVSRRR